MNLMALLPVDVVGSPDTSELWRRFDPNVAQIVGQLPLDECIAQTKKIALQHPEIIKPIRHKAGFATSDSPFGFEIGVKGPKPFQKICLRIADLDSGDKCFPVGARRRGVTGQQVSRRRSSYLLGRRREI
jgi:hypothetical protein